MSGNEPRDHHYVPRFYLRNFAVDDHRRRVTALAKHGRMADWAERSIASLGYERDFYVHIEDGGPVSVETDINTRIETPISGSDTWCKIVEGRAHQLDQTDRPVLYALVRHLEVRTPHYLDTVRQLSKMAANPESDIAFSDDERRRYADLRAHPGLYRKILNIRATTDRWPVDEFRRAMICVMRSANDTRRA